MTPGTVCVYTGPSIGVVYGPPETVVPVVMEPGDEVTVEKAATMQGFTSWWICDFDGYCVVLHPRHLKPVALAAGTGEGNKDG